MPVPKLRQYSGAICILRGFVASRQDNRDTGALPDRSEPRRLPWRQAAGRAAGPGLRNGPPPLRTVPGIVRRRSAGSYGSTSRPPAGSVVKDPRLPSSLLSLDDSSGGWIFLRRRRAGRPRQRGGKCRWGCLRSRLAGVCDPLADSRNPPAGSGEPLADDERTPVNVGRTMTNVGQSLRSVGRSMAGVGERTTNVGESLADAGRSMTNVGETTTNAGETKLALWAPLAGQVARWLVSSPKARIKPLQSLTTSSR